MRYEKNVSYLNLTFKETKLKFFFCFSLIYLLFFTPCVDEFSEQKKIGKSHHFLFSKFFLEFLYSPLSQAHFPAAEHKILGEAMCFLFEPLTVVPFLRISSPVKYTLTADVDQSVMVRVFSSFVRKILVFSDTADSPSHSSFFDWLGYLALNEKLVTCIENFWQLGFDI